MKKELTAIEQAFKKAVEDKTKKNKGDIKSLLFKNKQVSKPELRVNNDNHTKDE